MLLGVCALAPVAFATAVTAPASAARPNIIVIVTDDHGWADLGCQGSAPGVKTPNLDALASDGVRFSRGYVSAPTKPGMWDGSLNDPFVGEKGMLTDGGIRVPFLAAWPGTLATGRIFAPPVISLDILTTALGAAGVEARPEWKLDGVNLLPFLTGRREGAPRRELFWRYSSQAAVATDRWKLLFLAPDRWMLFDHRNSAGETRDVAAQHPAVVADLRARLEVWCAEQSPTGLPTVLKPVDAEFFRRHGVAAPSPQSR